MINVAQPKEFVKQGKYEKEIQQPVACRKLCKAFANLLKPGMSGGIYEYLIGK